MGGASDDFAEPVSPYVLSLNGDWKISWCGDPAQRPLDFWKTDFDDSTWETVDVPSCVEMSAWYLFSAMGFYPFNPCGGEYVIGAPQVPAAQVKVGGEGEQRTFRILVKGLSKENKYVKSVTLNGRAITDRKIRHADITKGGELVFEMCRRGCAE